MSAPNENNEKVQSAISANIYPDLPPPYTPKTPSDPQLPLPPTENKHNEPDPSAEKDKDIIRPIDFRPSSMRLTCPSCKAEVMTRTEKTPTLRTHACACLLFWLVWWPCICLPYCLPGCNDVDHFCPNCDSYIGGFKC
ncbi:lipopolysaccharide-induced tumor necrosis factor-alpha factor homolog [Plodia interpunctella]|uniref:lipopolysaccharide-induced tumor necrosis factor-alpha factor homolog n=1 Tax=Plodia interpunctella TaxID=58824 RepID=UPI002368C070|nr:lipopolysaccharide-induced tumor necrosis factor-alpha factor homolog [Plodia interpunctella]